jgi:hypothetical protein
MNSKLKSYFHIWCLVAVSLCWFSCGSEAAELQQLDMAEDLQKTRLLLNRTIAPGEDLVVQVPGPEKRQKKGPLYREGEVIVKFRKDIWIFHIRYRQQAPSRLLVIQLLPLV